MKKVLSFLFVFTVGGLGGVFVGQLLMPYLAGVSPFSNIEFIRQSGSGITIVNPVEEVIIAEDTAVEDAIDRIKPRLVVVQVYQNGKPIPLSGTGFIVTSDGLIAAPGTIVSRQADEYVIIRGSEYPAELAGYDVENNLALFRIEENNLPVVSFADLNNLRLGARIALVGAEIDAESAGNNLNYFANVGVIRRFENKLLAVDLDEKDIMANGSPLINIRGEVIGLNIVDSKGLVSIISADKIREAISLTE